MKNILFCAFLLGILACKAIAQGVAPTPLSYATPNVAVTENFDNGRLAASGTSSTLPTGFGFVETGSNADTTYTVGTGSSTTGDTYSFGATGSTERALGGLQSGSLIPTIGARFTNNTGSTLTSVTIAYTGEQWRLGATARTDQLDFQYSTNATSLSSGTFTDLDALDFVAPTTAGTVGPLDGNATANRTTMSATLPVTVANGSTLTIRWNDFNASGADDGLAIDDFSFLGNTNGTTPTPVATPTPYPTATGANTLIISEYRPGPTASTSNDYVELYNASGSALDASGYTLVAGTSNPGSIIGTIPTDTTIPARGHYLLTGTSYSLADYGGTNAATGNATLTGDIPRLGGVALVNASGQIVDQVGVAGFLEGTAVPAAPTTGEYAYVRQVITGGSGEPIDSNNNASDFILVSTASTSQVAMPRLGAPGPENLSSPIQSNGSLPYAVVSQFRNGSGASGTLTLRRRITNNSQVTITLIRLRAVQITAGTGGTGNNTPIVSGNGSTAPGVNNSPALPTSGSIGFKSLTLEGPTQPNGGGLNSSLTTGTISLAPGQTIDVEYTLNVQGTGAYQVVVSLEANARTTTTLSDNDNMLLGNPSNAGTTDEDNRLVVHDEYALGYSRSNGEPKWVSWHLQASDIVSNATRQDNFRADPLLPAASQITGSEYSGSGYSRGHQCPSGDRTSTQTANDNTFYMSNMLPQTTALNSGTWGTLEDYCRTQVSGGANEAYIMSGGIGGTTTIDNGKVKVPASCWKVVIILPVGNNDISRITASTRIVAVIIPNTTTVSGSWTNFTTTVDNIEAQTGLDLLSNVPTSVQTPLEARTGTGN